MRFVQSDHAAITIEITRSDFIHLNRMVSACRQDFKTLDSYLIGTKLDDVKRIDDDLYRILHEDENHRKG